MSRALELERLTAAYAARVAALSPEELAAELKQQERELSRLTERRNHFSRLEYSSLSVDLSPKRRAHIRTQHTIYAESYHECRGRVNVLRARLNRPEVPV